VKDKEMKRHWGRGTEKQRDGEIKTQIDSEMERERDRDKDR